MNKYVSRGLWLALIVGGLTVAGASAANAAETHGDDGTLSGTQAVTSTVAPLTLGGNAISVLGDSSTSNASSTSSDATPASSGDATTDGSNSLGSGTQLLPGITVPIGVSGNAISVLGDSDSNGSSTSGTAGTSSTGSDSMTTGENGVAGGSQVAPDAAVPIGVSGNAISLLGDSDSSDSSAAGTTTSDGTAVEPTTTGENGVAGGSQVAPDVAAPVGVSGNAISLLGDSSSSNASSTSGTAGMGGAGGGSTTTGEGGVAGGSQLAPAIVLPVSLSGNAISPIGDSTTTGSTTTVTPTEPSGPSGPSAGDPALPAEGPSTAALSLQALASTGTDAAPAFGMVGLLLAAGLTFVMLARKKGMRR